VSEGEKVEKSIELHSSYPIHFLKFNVIAGRPHLCGGLPVSFFKDDLAEARLIFQ